MTLNPRRLFGIGIAILAAALTSHAALAQALNAEDGACGSFSRSDRLPPEDYRKPSPRLRVVEDFHFGPNVETLVRPMQVGMSFGSDIDYTLWGYPNHHRALVTLVRLGVREKTDKPRGTQFTIDCYFRRALRIASDDLIVRMLYASYLGSTRNKPDAARQMAFVVESAKDDAVMQFNAGLVYLELEMFDEAAAQARRAKALGLERPTLQDELRRRGRWPAEAPVAAASAPASATPAAASAASR